MAFIRVKKSKRKDGNTLEYAYIVESRRVWKKTRQKSKKYLGKVYRFDRASVMDVYELYKISDVDSYLKEKSKEEVILDLVKLELFNHGFKEEGKRWKRGGCVFNLSEKKILNEKGKDAALAFNEGFLTG